MNQTKQSPWRTPVFWLVVGLPLLAIVAGVGLVVIAVRSGGADAVSDPVRRVSQIQTADLGPDAAAKKLGLSAVLRVEDGIVEVLPATGKFDRAAPLRLHLEHPTTQARDLQLLDEAYRVEKLQPVDMFPHTHHIENVALLELREYEM